MKLTEEERQELKRKKHRARMHALQDLDRYYRHVEDGPLVGWPSKEETDRKNKMWTILVAAFVVLEIVVPVLLYHFHIL